MISLSFHKSNVLAVLTLNSYVLCRLLFFYLRNSYRSSHFRSWNQKKVCLGFKFLPFNRSAETTLMMILLLKSQIWIWCIFFKDVLHIYSCLMTKQPFSGFGLGIWQCLCKVWNINVVPICVFTRCFVQFCSCTCLLNVTFAKTD